MRAFLGDMTRAITLLTILPTRYPSSDGEGTDRTAAFFPVVGLLVGTVTVLALAAVNSLEHVISDEMLFDRLAPMLSPMVLVLWAAMTRLLHWDGLADVGDAWWGGHTAERRLEIMRDSRVGAFGAATIVMISLIQVASITTILENASAVGWSLFAVPVLGRLSATFAAWLGKPARSDGLGLSVMRRPDLLGLIVVILALAVGLGPLVALLGTKGLAVAIVGLILAPVVPHLVSMRFGGVTGDVMGASVLITETLILFTAAVVGVV